MAQPRVGGTQAIRDAGAAADRDDARRRRRRARSTGSTPPTTTASSRGSGCSSTTGERRRSRRPLGTDQRRPGDRLDPRLQRRTDGTDGMFFYFDDAAGRTSPMPRWRPTSPRAPSGIGEHSIPISKFVLPHYYEFGSNVFAGLSDWGVEFVGTVMQPGDPYYGSAWVDERSVSPLRVGRHQLDRSSVLRGLHPVPGHPELDGRFFNCVTEIRDENGYEWYPTNDVAGHDRPRHGAADAGLRQPRAGDPVHSRVLHPEHLLRRTGAASCRASARTSPTTGRIYMTMDDACRYVRAVDHLRHRLRAPTTPALRRCGRC